VCPTHPNLSDVPSIKLCLDIFLSAIPHVRPKSSSAPSRPSLDRSLLLKRRSSHCLDFHWCTFSPTSVLSFFNLRACSVCVCVNLVGIEMGNLFVFGSISGYTSPCAFFCKSNGTCRTALISFTPQRVLYFQDLKDALSKKNPLEGSCTGRHFFREVHVE
jgi:hypothetical protein